MNKEDKPNINVDTDKEDKSKTKKEDKSKTKKEDKSKTKKEGKSKTKKEDKSKTKKEYSHSGNEVDKFDRLVERNKSSGRPWYYGLEGNWWWGVKEEDARIRITEAQKAFENILKMPINSIVQKKEDRHGIKKESEHELRTIVSTKEDVKKPENVIKDISEISKVETKKEDKPDIKTDMKEDKPDIKTDMKEDKPDIKTDMKEDKTDIKTDIKEDKTDIKNDIKEDKTDIKNDIKEDKTEV